MVRQLPVIFGRWFGARFRRGPAQAVSPQLCSRPTSLDSSRHTIRRAIIDKNVKVPPGVQVGVNLQEDQEQGLTVTDSGIVVVPRSFSSDPAATVAGNTLVFSREEHVEHRAFVSFQALWARLG
ncbi:hypothetical protein GCM10008955_20330 [Deinococcus malanensis]|uniref:Glucose-1-phosphate adenylyltransferase/Bifunctional protein GlmU-like C-terminal hexapeptide domain-containing protein n=1 Tax=Deinococcus malanensis TaxID=1706855 RepID=A0ABQ2EUN3_9DEIO|nr:hypothetical protein [Deinococcus malanensis]GGK26448.1 hypothetical protein GCM10008955_20330 [Deinococcus malanensis]